MSISPLKHVCNLNLLQVVSLQDDTTGMIPLLTATFVFPTHSLAVVFVFLLHAKMGKHNQDNFIINLNC